MLWSASLSHIHSLRGTGAFPVITKGMLCFPFGCYSRFEHRGLCPRPWRGDAGSWRITNTLTSFPVRYCPCGKREVCDTEKSQSDLKAQLRDASNGRQLPEPLPKPSSEFERHSD